MSQMVEIELPDELAAALQRDAAELGGELRLTAAVKWYELGRLSQGKAAEAAGLSRAAFISELARFGVSPFQETAEEVLNAVRLPPK
jgi:predicted HTH domain antitoxin